MKIAINTRFLLKDKLEGIGWVTYELVKRMVENHPEDEFLFFFDRPHDPRFIFGKNVTPVEIFPPARHPFLWYWWFEISVPRYLKKYQPDLFFSPDGYCSTRTSVPTVMITHDIAHIQFPKQIPGLVKSYYNHFVPKFLNHADKIITVSEFTKTNILEYYPIPSEKIEVVYNGCREGFIPQPENERKKTRTKYASGQEYFFYVGAVHPRKNLDRVIKAFDDFKQKTGSKVKFLMGGRMAWQTDAVQQAYEKSMFKNDIDFIGYIPDEELPLLMGGALAFVYVSLFEGFGLPVLEAMHCDIPVITSDCSSLPEVAGNACLLVDPKDTSAITSAMIDLFENEKLRQTLIEKGKRQRTLFDWETSAEKAYQVLKEVASNI